MVTFHQAGSDVKVTEKIVLTDTEEDITVPGKMRVVYDYRNVRRQLNLKYFHFF